MNSTPIYGAPFVREDGKRVTHGIRERAGVFCKAATATLAVDAICPIPFNSTSVVKPSKPAKTRRNPLLLRKVVEIVFQARGR